MIIIKFIQICSNRKRAIEGHSGVAGMGSVGLRLFRSVPVLLGGERPGLAHLLTYSDGPVLVRP